MSVLPTRTELVPWTDRRGRLHPLRAVVFTLLLLPALWLAVRWPLHDLGAEPVNAAIHSTGYWTIWLLLASLAITPLKALSGLMNVVVVRRMIGNAALCYALLHLVLYAADQNWRMLTVISEIVKRFYLTIGFVALCGLVVLGATSTDGWMRKLGRTWKQIHRVVYGLIILGLIHYVLQSKLDVSHAILAAGVFAWFMLWRVLPSGRDRTWPVLLGITAVSCAVTLATEYLWYRFGTRINPMKVMAQELDIAYGLHPAGQVLLLGVVAALVTELRRLSLSAFADKAWFTMLVYALGALVAGGAALFNGWSYDDVLPDWASPVLIGGVWFVLFALLGFARWRMQAQRARVLLDGLWAACILYQVALLATGDTRVGGAVAILVALGAIAVATQLMRRSRVAALMVSPAVAFLTYSAVTLLKGGGA